MVRDTPLKKSVVEPAKQPQNLLPGLISVPPFCQIKPYPHYKEFQVNKWNIIAFSTETSGAIRRTTVGPPVNNEVVPPHPPVGADGNDPIHPDDHGPPPEDDVNMPPDGANGSGEQDDSDFDMDDPHVNPPPGGQPPFPPQPPCVDAAVDARSSISDSTAIAVLKS